MTKSPEIFLSYNREDEAVALQFSEAFGKEGLSVWWDTELRSGENYDIVTEAALREAKAVVVLWSPRSVGSRWVRAEATIADRRKTLIPVTIEPCDKPVIFELTQTADLSGWNGDLGHPSWRSLVVEIREFLGRDPELGMASGQPAKTPALPPVKHGERGDAPTLAVLPFTNRSGLEEDEVFAIGMVEDVIDTLSHAVNVRVISSSATARFYTGKLPDIEALGEQLGVRYLLEGNVRRSGKVLRVTAQLVEAGNGEIVWTQRFEKPLAELAALQEDLIEELAAHLGTQVYRMAMEQALKKPRDLTAWEFCMRGLAALRQLNGDSVGNAIKASSEAISIDPEYGLAHALFAHSSALAYHFLSPDNPAEVKRIKLNVDRALACDGESAPTLAHVAFGLMYLGELKDSLNCSMRAHNINPGYGFAQLAAGICSPMLGKHENALSILDDFMQIEPQSPYLHYALNWQGVAYLGLDNYEAAESVFRESMLLNPLASYTYWHLALICSHLGNTDEARQLMAEARQREPTADLDLWQLRLSRWGRCNQSTEDLKAHLDDLWAETDEAV